MERTRPLLILDIDETLVYATDDVIDSFDFKVGPYHVRKRPHVDLFLETVRSWYDLAVWTSASSRYAATLVPKLFGGANLRFVWSGERCVRRMDRNGDSLIGIKDLNKVKRAYKLNLDRVVMVDDTPEKLSRHYGNHIRVQEWTGDSNDEELAQLLPFLDWLREQSNFRTIEKRGWRSFRRSS